MTKFEFIHRINHAAEEASTRGALFNKQVLFAQAALESDWGNTELAKDGNNLFAIKAGETWPGDTIRLPGREWNRQNGWHQEETVWRKYSSWTECVFDYAVIISSLPWYQDALRSLNNPDLFIKAILPQGIEPGWATDPWYYEKIREIAADLEKMGGPPWDGPSH